MVSRSFSTNSAPDPDTEKRRTLDAVALAPDAGADLNTQTGSGCTVPYLAAAHRQGDVIGLLAERGAVLDVRNVRGQTPLGLAASGPSGTAL